MSENVKREQCVRCSIKHLAQAKILIDESHLGYPHHVWYAMGHMAEAEAECVGVLPEEAAMIRETRLAVEKSLGEGAPTEEHPQPSLYFPDIRNLMEKVAVAGLLPEVMHPADIPRAPFGDAGEFVDWVLGCRPHA